MAPRNPKGVVGGEKRKLALRRRGGSAWPGNMSHTALGRECAGMELWHRRAEGGFERWVPHEQHDGRKREDDLEGERNAAEELVDLGLGLAHSGHLSLANGERDREGGRADGRRDQRKHEAVGEDVEAD